MYIGGMAGTGKSQVFKALLEFFSLKNESHRLIVVAPTGSAAALLGGSTYHSAFGINTDSS
jgi:PIF1-like helicase